MQKGMCLLKYHNGLRKCFDFCSFSLVKRLPRAISFYERALFSFFSGILVNGLSKVGSPRMLTFFLRKGSFN